MDQRDHSYNEGIMHGSLIKSGSFIDPRDHYMKIGIVTYNLGRIIWFLSKKSSFFINYIKIGIVTYNLSRINWFLSEKLSRYSKQQQ